MTREVTQATLALEGINDRPGQEPGAQPVASICIATGRRPELLARCLDSLGHQEAAPTFEVLVCADGDASVVDLARRHLPEARVIVVPRANRTILRNRLMVQARGDLLVFLDDDVVVEKGFLRRLQDLSVAHPEIGVFGGPNLTPDQSSVFQITQGAVLGSLVAAGPVRRRYGRPRRVARTAKGLGRPGLSLLAVLVGRQLRLQTKRSKIGIAWPIVAPLFLLALYSLVFKGVFHVPIKRYPEYLFAGLLPWTFLVQSLASAISSISDEPDLIRRARFAYEALPLATVTAMSVYFLVTLGGFLVYLGVTGHLVFHLLPALVAPLASLYLLVGAISLVLSLIDVYNRDLRRVLANLLTIWFFLEPIVYRQEMLGGGLLFLRSVDPVNMIVGEFRDLLVYGHLPPPAHVAELLAISGAVYLICVQVFRRFAPNLPKVV